MGIIRAHRRAVTGLLAAGSLAVTGALAVAVPASADLVAPEVQEEAEVALMEEPEPAAVPGDVDPALKDGAAGGQGRSGSDDTGDTKGGIESEDTQKESKAAGGSLNNKEQPEVPDAQDSEPDGPQMLRPQTFAATLQSTTTAAIQDLAICTQNAIERNDDGSSDEYDLSFPINFFGTTYNSLWVNNNGNITFNGGLSQYTPEDLTGPTGNPMIAPFFADVDTRGTDSKQVTYGSDATTFCANWVNVGYYETHTDKLISAQLIIEDMSGSGQPGDVRVTFNYSDIGWETGDASHGTGGLGGTSVAVGYTAGTGEAGTYTQLQGSLVPGALIDGGPNALTEGSRNSSVQGRYIFFWGGDEVILEGSISGTVTNETGDVLSGIRVEMCPTTGACVETTTTALGTYSTVGLAAGDYVVTAFAPADSTLRNAQRSITVVGGEHSEVDLVLREAVLSELTVNVVTVDGDVVPDASVRLCDQYGDCFDAGITDDTGSLTVSDLPTDEYGVHVYPAEGSRLQEGWVMVTVTEEPTSVTVVLPPVTDLMVKVEVVDQIGAPIGGAVVTIGAHDGESYVPLTDSSPLLDAESENPQTANDQGRATWTVADGQYQVRATSEGCTDGAAETDGFDAEGIAELRIALTCVTATPPPNGAAVTPPANGTGSLPALGADIGLAGMALALLGAGTLVTVLQVRRQRQH